MSFEWPLLLLTLGLVPLVLVAYVILERRRARYAVRFTNLEVLAAVAGRTGAWKRWLPPALFLLALATCFTALARPHVTMPVAREQASVVLTIEVSGSMMADDVRPTRLLAAREAVRRFLDRLPSQYRVGIVAFSSEAQVLAPLTRNRDLARDALTYLAPGAGTAIGDALARSVDLARGVPDSAGGDSAPPPASGSGDRPLTAILLLSDGYQTRGLLQPLEGAGRAKSYGIPVYTVALGTPNGVITMNRGGFRNTIPVPPDPATLRRIARTTGGEFFEAKSGPRLNEVYERLGSRLGRTKEPREATFALLGAAAAFVLAAATLSMRWLNRLP